MKTTIGCIIGVLVAIQLAHAEPVPDWVPRRPDIDGKILAQPFAKDAFVAKLKSKFSHITSFGYAYDSPEIANNFAYCWKEMGNAFYSEIIDGPMDNTFAFDGKRTRVLPRNGYIYVKNGENRAAAEPPWYSPLDLYAFLRIDNQLLSARALRPDAPLWKSLAARIDYAGTTNFMGSDCIVLRFRGSYSELKRESADYDVYFDAASLAPLGWQAYDGNKIMLDELSVADVAAVIGNATGNTFAYSPAYRLIYYQEPGTLIKEPSGEVINYRRETSDVAFDDVEINSLVPRDLQIDLSLAKGIMDEDTQKCLRFQR